jgi:hypothetical protein
MAISLFDGAEATSNYSRLTPVAAFRKGFVGLAPVLPSDGSTLG